MNREEKPRKRILIVEDEATLSYFLAYSLMAEYEEFDTVTVRDAETALLKTEEKKFDVIISAIFLPKKSGFTLIYEIKKRWPDTKVILMTAYNSPEAKAEAVKRGAFAYIEKPFLYSSMLELVRKALVETSAPSPK